MNKFLFLKGVVYTLWLSISVTALALAVGASTYSPHPVIDLFMAISAGVGVLEFLVLISFSKKPLQWPEFLRAFSAGLVAFTMVLIVTTAMTVRVLQDKTTIWIVNDQTTISNKALWFNPYADRLDYVDKIHTYDLTLYVKTKDKKRVQADVHLSVIIEEDEQALLRLSHPSNRESLNELVDFECKYYLRQWFYNGIGEKTLAELEHNLTLEWDLGSKFDFLLLGESGLCRIDALRITNIHASF